MVLSKSDCKTIHRRIFRLALPSTKRVTACIASKFDKIVLCQCWTPVTMYKTARALKRPPTFLSRRLGMTLKAKFNPPLCRRLRDEFTLVYNASNGSFEECFTRLRCSRLRRQYPKLHHRRFRLSRRKVAFTRRIVRPNNKLSAFVVGSSSVDVFKSKLDTRWTEVCPMLI